MLLSKLSRKEKLKYLDLALHMVEVDGSTTSHEQRLLNMMLAEVGDDIVKEYSFFHSSDLDETVEFFKSQSISTRNIVFLNLIKLSMIDDFYNTSEHFFLENIMKKFNISNAKRSDLVALVFEERDLKEKARRICLT
ncbi:MAG: hypothetical protein GX149_02935 [Acholeplasmataceae bacterium]|jgi:hypothetical protein|nr:hypothetical protein [Acholeplasmataceae bacterium]